MRRAAPLGLLVFLFLLVESAARADEPPPPKHDKETLETPDWSK